MADNVNVLLAMYNEQCNQARHYESQRATVSGFLIAISAALIGLMTYDKSISRSDLPPAIFLLALGIFGALSSSKHYERSLRHGKRAQKYREKLNELIPELGINELRVKADEETNSRFKRLYKLRLHHIWHFLHFIIILMSLWLIIAASKATTG
jgi:hypothetical protein